MLGSIKHLDKSINDNSARRLDHYDVIASRAGFGVPHSEIELQTEFNTFIATHWGSNTNQHMDWAVGGTRIKPIRSVYASNSMLSVRLQLFKYRGSADAQWISMNKWPRWQVQREVCATIFSENIEDLWFSCYNENNDRGCLGVVCEAPSAQDEWLRSLGFWLHHSPLALGCFTTNTQQPQSFSPNQVDITIGMLN